VVTDGFGPVEFQLVLLRRMADHQPALVEDALRTLGASHADLREANRRWQAWGHGRHGPRGERRYRMALDEPEAEETRRVGDLTFRALRWPVPLWPSLRFEVLCAPRGGATWNEWLIRAPGAAGPALRTTEDLKPWSCTVDEVARAFAPAEPMEGDAPSRWRLGFTDPEDGAARVAHFTWGLLQYVD
jgi:hypothetical protein